MSSILERLQAADRILAPYAVPHGGMLGRVEKEPEDETRFPFQRDRDRIIHAQAFRRLQGKTQVFVAGEEDDHVRTRLTHTMEVAQIGRDIARTLSLNEDLAECIALAHDLGHPPFGHRGEEVLNTWMTKHGSSFEHNEQSVRIVTVLEVHSPLTQGLNLNQEILEGLRKHREAYIDPPVPFPRNLSLEAQVINKADEVAYYGHDCDDGVHAKLFSLDDLLSTVPLAREAAEHAQMRGTSLRGAIIHLLVTDLYAESLRLLAQHGIHSLADCYHAAVPLIEFSSPMIEQTRTLRDFLHHRMYEHPRVTEPSGEGQRIIRLLCDALYASPSPPVLALQSRTNSSLPEAVKDYVAGMTDTFARSLSASLNLH